MSRHKHIIFNYAKKTRQSKRGLIIALLVGIAVLLAVAAAIFYIKSRPKPVIPAVAAPTQTKLAKAVPKGVTSSQLDQQEETFTGQLASDEAKLDGLVQ